MADIEPDPEALLARWRSIGAADRQAIIASLPDERRRQLQDLLDESGDPANAADRQFQAYSRWLAPLVRAACADDASLSPIKPKVREAMRVAHGTISPKAVSTAPSLPWLNRLRAVTSEWISRS